MEVLESALQGPGGHRPVQGRGVQVVFSHVADF